VIKGTVGIKVSDKGAVVERKEPWCKERSRGGKKGRWHSGKVKILNDIISKITYYF